eukprot:TRINITY_DN11799_c0_g1_i1.p1 TRINITY_DN11799_c0_g1~~TRINITY_DN11799_c0_g1_i1.p1  ORF type:complete len:324 (+),score=81.08 TRINITY_DN11799_c0_g1_i1:52-972(+)
MAANNNNNNSKKDLIVTHNLEDVPLDLNQIITRLKSAPANSLTLSLEDELRLLKELTEFELGCFILKNRGFNGHWAAHLYRHYLAKKAVDHPLENWLIFKCPAVTSTCERFKIFQEKIKKHAKSGSTLLSIPCGLMDDLLTIDFSHLKDLRLVGADLDKNAIIEAKNNAIQNKKEKITVFIEKNAWKLDEIEEYDIITSNGLNVYVLDENSVKQLWREYHRALKPEGILITSFLSETPFMTKNSSWKNYEEEDLKLFNAVLTDIVAGKWFYIKEETIRKQLENVGFTIIEIVYDPQGVWGTIVAKK